MKTLGNPCPSCHVCSPHPVSLLASFLLYIHFYFLSGEGGDPQNHTLTVSGQVTPIKFCCRRLSILLGDCDTFTSPLLNYGQITPIKSCCRRLSIPLGDCHTFTSPLLSYGQATPIKSCCMRFSIPLGDCHIFTSP